MRVCFYTLGCKVNLNETEALEQLFKRSGFTVVPDGEDADVYIVNSCTVTNFGAQKSRKWLRQAKRKNPGAVTVMSGCWPQASPEAAAGMTEADVVCGTTNRRAILGYVNQMLEGHERIVAIQPHERGEAFEELPVDRFETHTRAFIKVEDGCNRRCAYCVIPRARGPVRSRAEESILAELRQLAAAGYREAVLSAISLPSYGSDTGTDLYELIEHCAAVEGIERIRLGSLDPDMLTPEGIRRMAAVDKLCPQFHLSLQSGCSTSACRAAVTPHCAGCAGPTPPPNTCRWCGSCVKPTAAGRSVLPPTASVVSPARRRRTLRPAAPFWSRWASCGSMCSPTPGGQIIEEEKQARSRRMHQRAEAVRARVLAGLEGMEDEVLLETPLSGTVFTGYTRLYVPVAVSAPGCAAGGLVRVRLGRYDGTRVRAEVIRDL